MDAASLLAAVSSIGVVFGWQPMPDDSASYEYIVQIEPELARQLAEGNAIPLAADVPDDIGPIGRIRIVVGARELPKRRLVLAMKPVVDGKSTDGVKLTQYNGPLGSQSPGGGADGAQRRYEPSSVGQGNGQSFDAFARQPAFAGGGQPAEVTNPFTPTDPAGAILPAAERASAAARQTLQDAARQTQQWAKSQGNALEGQVRGATDYALRNAEETADNTLRPSGQILPPATQQLFGADSGGQFAATQPITPQQTPWNQSGQQQNPALAGRSAPSNPLERIGDGLQRVVDPLRGGVEQMDDRLRNAADKLGARSRQLFDNLGRPIPALAGRERSILGGRESSGPIYPGISQDQKQPAPSTRDAQGHTSPGGWADVDSRHGFGDPRTPLAQTRPEAQPTASRPGSSQSYDQGALPNDQARPQDDRDWAATGRRGVPPVADQRASAWPNASSSRNDRAYDSNDRADIANRAANSADSQIAANPQDSIWPPSGPGFPNLGADGSSASAAVGGVPSIEKRMLADRADAPVPEVADSELTFPSDIRTSSPEQTLPFDAPVSFQPSPQADPGARPSAAALGWDNSQTVNLPNLNGQSPSDDRGSEKSETADDDGASKLGLLMAWLLLSGSVAGNAYLFWSYLDVRNKYSSLVRKTARAVGGRFATA